MNSYDKNIKNKSYEIKMLLNLYFIAFVLKVVFIIVFFGLWIFFVILNIKNIIQRDVKHIKIMFFVSKCLVITLLLNKLTDSWSTPLFKVKLPTLLEPRLKLALKTTSPF